MKNCELDEALHRLEVLDECLGSANVPLSLAPRRQRATPLRAIGAFCLKAEYSADIIWSFVESFCCVVEAKMEYFPENIFWDFDYLATSMLTGALHHDVDAACHLRRMGKIMAQLMATFGRNSPIRFRYVHDFMYGFDWAKWVAKQPLERDEIGPFDLKFLEYMQRRGDELCELISNDDAKYSRLRTTAYRNPFPFVRDPDYEICLMSDMAHSGLIPVETWRFDAKPTWCRPYADLRIARAQELGIPLNL